MFACPLDKKTVFAYSSRHRHAEYVSPQALHGSPSGAFSFRLALRGSWHRVLMAGSHFALLSDGLAGCTKGRERLRMHDPLSINSGSRASPSLTQSTTPWDCARTLRHAIT